MSHTCRFIGLKKRSSKGIIETTTSGRGKELFFIKGQLEKVQIEHTHISLDIAGWIFSSFSVGTLLSAMIQGAFSRWINPKYLLLSSMVILATAGLVVASTHVFGVLLIAQFLLGMA